MSIRLSSAADYLQRGTPASGGVYADDATCFPLYHTCSAKGLLYRHAAITATYEPIACWSRRFDGGSYYFSGSTGNNRIYVDPGNGGNSIVNAPPLLTWWQWALRNDRANGSEASIFWKLLGDLAWQKATSMGGALTWAKNPGIFLLGQDEWGSNSSHYTYDNVVIFDVAKSDAQLLAEADSASPIDAAHVWAWWKMRSDIGLGIDSSVNARHLTLVGAPIAGASSPLEAPPDVVPVSDASGVVVPRRFMVAAGAAGAIARASGSASPLTLRASGSASARSTSTGSAVLRRLLSASGSAALVLPLSSSAVGAIVLRRFLTAAGAGSSIARAAGSARMLGRVVVRGRVTVGESAEPVDSPTSVRINSVNTSVIISTRQEL